MNSIGWGIFWVQDGERAWLGIYPLPFLGITIGFRSKPHHD